MLRLDIPITKVDAARRLVYGVATAEVADRTGEVCDYASTKPMYEKWSEAIANSTGGKSLGNLRAMHGAVAAGKVTALTFNDAAKQIEICAKVVDDAEWGKVEEGVYTGFSQGGTYARRWTDADGVLRYTANPHEISLVDLPCLAEARFEMVKADGSHEWRRFQAQLDTSDVMKVALGADCPAIKVSGGADLTKVADTLAKAVDAVTKRLDQLDSSFVKALADVGLRLKAIEDQPQPLPFAGAVRSVGKQEDRADDQINALLADPGTLSLLAIKLAQRQAR